jgi:hypothetical protein
VLQKAGNTLFASDSRDACRRPASRADQRWWSIFFLGLQPASGVLKTPSYRGTNPDQGGACYQGLLKQSKIHVALLLI